MWKWLSVFLILLPMLCFGASTDYKVDNLGKVYGYDFIAKDGADYRFYVRPEWFGAVANGTTDDAAAFTAALAASNFVKLAPGKTYAVGSTITVTGDKTIAGESGGSQATQLSTIYHLPSSTGELFNVTSFENGGVALRNFNITGGNGSFAIVSSRPSARYEYIHMEPYSGGGIQLLATGKGSSSSTIRETQWVSEASPNSYTGYLLQSRFQVFLCVQRLLTWWMVSYPVPSCSVLR